MPVYRSLWKGLRTYAWFVAAAWALIVAVNTAQLLLTGSFEVGPALRWALMDWLPWLALAPLVAWLSVIFPFGRKTWPLSLLVHMTACVLVVVGCAVMARWLIPAPMAHWPAQRAWRSRPGGRSPAWMNHFDFQRARIQAPIYWLIVSVMSALVHYRASQEKDRRAAELSASLAKANLQALQHQLQPHFLFNALNAIAALVHSNPAAADDMIANLSDLLRRSLDLSREPEIPLCREMEILSCYLEIERARFQDRLEVKVEVEPAALDAWLPALLLQPLVENAVHHGLEAKTRSAPIAITARIADGYLHLTVADRGPGVATRADGTIKDGIGLANTRARLQELYGERASLKITNGPGGGCVATAILPHHVKPIAELGVASSE
jgi:signal transduction histidine kinase